jgi:hypothetical protein
MTFSTEPARPCLTIPLGTRPGRFHLTAQQEVRDLYALLQLPTNDRAADASARAEWFASAALPLEADDLVAD